MKKMLILLLAIFFVLPMGEVQAKDFSENFKSRELEKYEPMRINDSVNVYLYTNSFSRVTSDNNWINASIRVTNADYNPGPIYVRVTNLQGEILVPDHYIAVGTTETLTNRVPWNSGEYVVKAMAVDRSGNYTLTVKDW
ncbi:hypothetical protein SAMN00017477_0310 [Peptoniphilus asaccharolyticus DSM 20463]|uniref:Uncharacterized protein n=1 Tax=Peptoniphilus asaccharolyticus DSM 20463 TaxID=573058 RepID=A0A1W1UIQ8_PEPAS|nr:hypothetical protein [Peptoniphilus asaccharolyticus]MBL7574790.1 hypothetical protein [Peptoniphilus asaccharolyticus]SMB81005.1 hypothetical protein SAMN00017477_0310 [Peptoniphilus asaccharolyticus DSM 20463]